LDFCSLVDKWWTNGGYILEELSECRSRANNLSTLFECAHQIDRLGPVCSLLEFFIHHLSTTYPPLIHHLSTGMVCGDFALHLCLCIFAEWGYSVSQSMLLLKRGKQARLCWLVVVCLR
jgi:hypothetical protein